MAEQTAALAQGAPGGPPQWSDGLTAQPPDERSRFMRHLPAAAVVGGAGAILILAGDHVAWFSLTAILGIAVVGLSILVGYAGQVSLGQAGIVALGAYGSAVTTATYGWPPVAGVAAGLVLTLAVAGVTSVLIRLRGLYLAIATLALGLLVQILIENLPQVTGGVNGLMGIPFFSVGGYTITDEVGMFVLAAALIAVAVWINSGITSSYVGATLRAIQDDEDAALSCSVPVVGYKVRIWLLAATYASLSGSLYAHYIGFVSPSQFGLDLSILLITAVVVGGMTSPLLGLLTLCALRGLPDLIPTGTVTPALAMGILLIVFVSFAPEGVEGLVRSVAARLRRGQSDAAR